MFLHSGASLHGHEYSARQSPQQNARRLPFIRSALRNPTDADTRTTPATVSPPSPGPPSRPRSYHEHVTTEPRTSRPRPTSEYMPPRRELSVRFREPETDDELPPTEAPPSEDEGSGALSDASDMSDCSSSTRKRTKRKRSPRKSNQFLLAHPVPRIRPRQRKIAPRPRLLLQLQDLTEKRPNPAFDVLPSSLVIGSSMMPKLARKCPGLFRSKPVLGLNDLLLVRSEDYDAPTAPGDSDEEDRLDQRDVIAIISPLPHMGDDACEIVMEDGCTWEASLMANGSYEFIGVDERGRISTARWVKKAVPSLFSTPVRVGSSITTPPASPTPPDFKWTFSMIHPDTRRHPIMGTLLCNTLDVFETYNTMSASSGRYPPTRPTGMDPVGAPDWLSNGAAHPEGRITKAVPEDIKLLMVASAAWLHLRQEGWPATVVSRPPPTTLQRRTLSNSFPQKPQAPPMRNSIAIPPTQNPPLPVPSPAPSLRDFPTQDSPAGRRRSMSSSGFVRRFVTPRVSEENGRPTVESIYLEADKAEKVEKTEKVDRPPSRRMSVRQIANKIFRRKSVSQAQTNEPFYKLEY